MFETLLIIGENNCASSEIFEALTNRWAMLPLLNYLRGNILFQLDKPKGIMCALFRNKGTILEEKFSNETEYLDYNEL